jgi:NAD+ synthase (glutamine-hydrolysing)
MKIVMAQLNYTIGDMNGNAGKIIDTIRANPQADLVIFSELCVTGYYPRDLLYRDGFLARQQAALDEIANATRAFDGAVVIGAVLANPSDGKPFTNSLLVLQDGVVTYQYNKQLLPTYGVFDEARHFEPGNSTGFLRIKCKNIGFLICEDAWEDDEHPLYDRNPVRQLSALDLDLVVSINASPCNVYKHAARHAVIRNVAYQVEAPVVYVNQVGGIDDLVFDGGSVVFDAQRQCLAQAPFYEEAVLAIDLADATPAVLQEPEPLPLIALQLRRGLIDYVAKCGFKKIVVGSSGGIDSAVVLALATWALGADHVTAITMPSAYSSAGSVDDSKALCDALKIPLFTYPIREQFTLDVANYTAQFGEPPGALAQENLQARIRGMLLMTYSNTTGAMVLTTGNKSESSVGYCTFGGDTLGGLALIGDLYKMEVFALARYLNADIFGREVIPEAIITKAPSAELAPDQRDEDSLPPYPQLDAVLRLFIEGDLLPTSERQACEATVAQMAASEVERVHKLVDRNEYKRRMAAPVIRVQRRSFGFDRQIPITTRVS